MNVATVGDVFSGVRRLCSGARHVLGETHPRLGLGEPQGLVFVAVGRARHGYALLGEFSMIFVGPHFTSPTYAILARI